MEMTASKPGRMSLLQMDVRTFVAVLAIASIPIAPALCGLRGGAFVQGGIGLLLALMTPRMRFGKITVLYVVFIGWLALGALYSIDITVNLFIILATGILTALAVSSYLDEKLDDWRAKLSFYASIYSWSTILVCLFCLGVEGFTGRLGYQVYENGGTYIYLSLNILISGVLSLWGVVYSEERRGSRCVAGIQAAFIVFFCMLSSTRKVILGLAACAILLVAYKNKVKPIRLIVWGLVLAAVLGGIVYLITTVPELQQTVGYRFETMVNSLLGDGLDQSMEERKRLRDLAIALFVKNPVFGIGTESFRAYASMAFGRYLYSHCNFTELLCNNGVIGFSLYYSIYALVIVESLRHKSDALRAFTLCSCVTLIVLDYSQVSYYQTPYVVFLFMLYSINRDCRDRLSDPDVARTPI